MKFLRCMLIQIWIQATSLKMKVNQRRRDKKLTSGQEKHLFNGGRESISLPEKENPLQLIHGAPQKERQPGSGTQVEVYQARVSQAGWKTPLLLKKHSMAVHGVQ
ncbi:hypothetical protein V2J09_016825 [Rumex salicifolius]